ncbi:MAG: D-alanyl-D-alanine carboxypeptidase, partial [Acidimicrobiales bacterium]
MRVIVAVVLALLIGTASLAGFQSYSSEREADEREPVPLAQGATAPAVTNRILSARRLTPALADATLERRLFSYLDSVEGSIPENSCLVVARLDGTVVASTRATAPMTPASTLKLVTAYSLLENFAPDHRFVTEILAMEQPVDGVIAGDLWLRGAGDPLLMTDGYAEAFSSQPQKRTPLSSVAMAIQDA